MKQGKALFVEFVADTSVGATWHQAGAVAEVDSETYKSLMREQLAVPAVGPLAAALATDQIRPFYEDKTPCV